MCNLVRRKKQRGAPKFSTSTNIERDLIKYLEVEAKRVGMTKSELIRSILLEYRKNNKLSGGEA